MQDLASAGELAPNYGTVDSDANAQLMLAMWHMTEAAAGVAPGGEEAPDPVVGRRMLRLAAARGHPDSLHFLAVTLYEDSPQDHVEARRLFGLAVQQQHPMRDESMYNLALMTLNGYGGPRDEVEARRLFGLGCERGHAGSLYQLGRMELNGRGGPQDTAAARHLLGLAAELGDSHAQGELAAMFANGVGGPPDGKEARRLFGLAAAQGSADAQVNLGIMNEDAIGGPEDLTEARRLYELAAAQGYAKGQDRLGVMHANGVGGPRDQVEARRLFGLAVAQGNASAQFHLAFMHSNGVAGPRDDAEARRLYGLAAAQGHPKAQQHLEALANALANALLAEEAAETSNATKARARKAKVRANQASADHSAACTQSQNESSTDGKCGEAADAGDAGARTLADEALMRGMADGEYEALASALEMHHAAASESVLAEARALRDKLKDRRKKQSQKQRRAHGGAMVAMAQLQTAQRHADPAVLEAALNLAAGHTSELPALVPEAEAARAMLASLSSASPSETSGDRSGEHAVCSSAAQGLTAVELCTDDVMAATDNFSAGRVVGTGGFGKVYAADVMASLPSMARQHPRVAVKRADTAFELHDVQTEIRILQSCSHAHLLTLYGFCLDAAALCLVRTHRSNQHDKSILLACHTLSLARECESR